MLQSLMSCLQHLVNKSEVRRVHSCSCWLRSQQHREDERASERVAVKRPSEETRDMLHWQLQCPHSRSAAQFVLLKVRSFISGDY